VPVNLAAAIYGLLAVSALLAAETPGRETYGETAGAVALACVAYWLARGYGDFVSRRVREGEPLSVRGFAQTMLREVSTVAGAAVPLLAIVLAWAAGAALSTALDAALWTAAATLVVIEVVAGVRADLSGRELLIQTLVGGALGLLVLALRLTLH
jgi:hypothetical protein